MDIMWLIKNIFVFKIDFLFSLKNGTNLLDDLIHCGFLKLGSSIISDVHSKELGDMFQKLSVNQSKLVNRFYLLFLYDKAKQHTAGITTLSILNLMLAVSWPGTYWLSFLLLFGQIFDQIKLSHRLWKMPSEISSNHVAKG